MAADAEQAAIDSAGDSDDSNGDGEPDDVENADSEDGDGEDVESLDDLREQELADDVASDTELTVRAIVGRERNHGDRQVRERTASESICESCFLIIRNEFLVDGLCPSCQ